MSARPAVPKGARTAAEGEAPVSTPHTQAAALQEDPRFALGRSIGMAAFTWGYPLVEMVRTCRLQTTEHDARAVTWRAAIDRVHHARHPATAQDRDVVTPANDLLYTTAWINLASGPRLLHVPSVRAHHGRYCVLALYDAWTNNFANPGARTSPPEGETVLLCGPGTPRDTPDMAWPEGVRVVESPTDLVWLVARVVVGEADDLPAARALQATIRLECPAGTDSGQLPACVAQWHGEPLETMAALEARPDDSEQIATAFFTNLCRSLADAPPGVEERGLAAWFTSAQLVAGNAFDWQLLEPALRAGLHQGMLDAVALLLRNSRSRIARPWAIGWGIGVYGHNYLVRALTAYKGLGALANSEAIYAMGDFDGDKQPLHGSKDYVLRFAAGDLPPVDAFWSITLYAADRFLHPNAIARFAIGDRTEGLRYDPDGGLTLRIGHHAPSSGSSNWLPAPQGGFYLVLRMYSPRPDVRSWRTPPLQVATA